MNSTTMADAISPLEQAYQSCIRLAQSHYENFPVASLLVPKELRRPICVIYAFARTADDIADEGKLNATQRIEKLEHYYLALKAIQNKSYFGSDDIFIALQDVIHRYHLPIELFTDLLSAFQQDINKNRYQDIQEILDYCRRSANPIGRLILHLNSQPTQKQLEQSDALCTALQLINFFQDIQQDLVGKNRLYLPQQDIDDTDVLQSINQHDTTALTLLLRQHYQQTQQLLAQSERLSEEISGRLAWQIRAITLSGLITLKLLSQQSNDKMLSRPRLSKWHLFLASVMAITRYSYYQFIRKLHKKIAVANSI